MSVKSMKKNQHLNAWCWYVSKLKKMTKGHIATTGCVCLDCLFLEAQ